MQNLLIFIWFICISICYGLENAYKFREIRADKDNFLKYNKLWHLFQAMQQILLYLIVWYVLDIYFAFLFGAIYWLIFDYLVHVVGLKQSIWYVGQTDIIDLFFRNNFKNYQFVYYGLKISLFIIAFTIFIIKNV